MCAHSLACCQLQMCTAGPAEGLLAVGTPADVRIGSTHAVFIARAKDCLLDCLLRCSKQTQLLPACTIINTRG